MIQGAIFDMDGLMFDTEPIWTEAWVPALAEFGLEIKEGLADACRGSSDESCVATLKRFYGDDTPGQEIMNTLRRLAQDMIAGDVRKKPCLDEILNYFSEQGVPCAVASSSTPQLITTCLHEAGIDDKFEATLSGMDMEHSKPHPEIFLKAAEALGTDPAQTLVLEDSYAGVRAGAAGGFITVMVPDMVQPDEEISQLYTACCHDLGEVRDLIAAGKLG